MSKTMVLPPIDACFLKAEGVIKPSRAWQAENAFQKLYLAGLLPRREELGKFSEEELRSWVSRNADELNKVLKDEGFDIQLEKFHKDEFGVVSILDVLVEWLVAGQKTKIKCGDSQYDAVEIGQYSEVDGQNRRLFVACSTTKHAHPIVVLETKSGDHVYMTIADRPLSGFELIERIDVIRGSLYHPEPATAVIFPMIDLNQQEDISGLKGMWTTDMAGHGWTVSQALQQTKFKMNERGARVKSAVAIAITRTSVKISLQKILIDRPFFLWIGRPGVSTPLMYAYIDEKDWKNPGDLSSM